MNRLHSVGEEKSDEREASWQNESQHFVIKSKSDGGEGATPDAAAASPPRRPGLGEIKVHTISSKDLYANASPRAGATGAAGAATTAASAAPTTKPAAGKKQNGAAAVEEWVACTDKDSGRTYYHNPKTGKTSWVRPTGASKPARTLPSPPKGTSAKGGAAEGGAAAAGCCAGERPCCCGKCTWAPRKYCPWGLGCGNRLSRATCYHPTSKRIRNSSRVCCALTAVYVAWIVVALAMLLPLRHCLVPVPMGGSKCWIPTKFAAGQGTAKMEAAKKRRLAATGGAGGNPEQKLADVCGMDVPLLTEVEFMNPSKAHVHLLWGSVSASYDRPDLGLDGATVAKVSLDDVQFKYTEAFGGTTESGLRFGNSTLSLGATLTVPGDLGNGWDGESALGAAVSSIMSKNDLTRLDITAWVWAAVNYMPLPFPVPVSLPFRCGWIVPKVIFPIDAATTARTGAESPSLESCDKPFQMRAAKDGSGTKCHAFVCKPGDKSFEQLIAGDDWLEVEKDRGARPKEIELVGENTETLATAKDSELGAFVSMEVDVGYNFPLVMEGLPRLQGEAFYADSKFDFPASHQLKAAGKACPDELKAQYGCDPTAHVETSLINFSGRRNAPGEKPNTANITAFLPHTPKVGHPRSAQVGKAMDRFLNTKEKLTIYSRGRQTEECLKSTCMLQRLLSKMPAWRLEIKPEIKPPADEQIAVDPATGCRSRTPAIGALKRLDLLGAKGLSVNVLPNVVLALPVNVHGKVPDMSFDVIDEREGQEATLLTVTVLEDVSIPPQHWSGLMSVNGRDTVAYGNGYHPQHPAMNLGAKDLPAGDGDGSVALGVNVTIRDPVALQDLVLGRNTGGTPQLFLTGTRGHNAVSSALALLKWNLSEVKDEVPVENDPALGCAPVVYRDSLKPAKPVPVKKPRLGVRVDVQSYPNGLLATIEVEPQKGFYPMDFVAGVGASSFLAEMEGMFTDVAGTRIELDGSGDEGFAVTLNMTAENGDGGARFKQKLKELMDGVVVPLHFSNGAIDNSHKAVAVFKAAEGVDNGIQVTFDDALAGLFQEKEGEKKKETPVTFHGLDLVGLETSGTALDLPCIFQQVLPEGYDAGRGGERCHGSYEAHGAAGRACAAAALLLERRGSSYVTGRSDCLRLCDTHDDCAYVTFWDYTGKNMVPEHRCQLFGRLADRAQQACGDAETGAGMGAATGASNHALQTYRRTSTAGKVALSLDASFSLALDLPVDLHLTLPPWFLDADIKGESDPAYRRVAGVAVDGVSFDVTGPDAVQLGHTVDVSDVVLARDTALEVLHAPADREEGVSVRVRPSPHVDDMLSRLLSLFEYVHTFEGPETASRMRRLKAAGIPTNKRWDSTTRTWKADGGATARGTCDAGCNGDTATRADMCPNRKCTACQWCQNGCSKGKAGLKKCTFASEQLKNYGHESTYKFDAGKGRYEAHGGASLGARVDGDSKTALQSPFVALGIDKGFGGYKGGGFMGAGTHLPDVSEALVDAATDPNHVLNRRPPSHLVPGYHDGTFASTNKPPPLFELNVDSQIDRLVLAASVTLKDLNLPFAIGMGGLEVGISKAFAKPIAQAFDVIVPEAAEPEREKLIEILVDAFELKGNDTSVVKAYVSLLASPPPVQEKDKAKVLGDLLTQYLEKTNNVALKLDGVVVNAKVAESGARPVDAVLVAPRPAAFGLELPGGDDKKEEASGEKTSLVSLDRVDVVGFDTAGGVLDVDCLLADACAVRLGAGVDAIVSLDVDVPAKFSLEVLLPALSFNEGVHVLTGGFNSACPPGLSTYGDGSACRRSASAGAERCARYGNPSLPRCFSPLGHVSFKALAFDSDRRRLLVPLHVQVDDIGQAKDLADAMQAGGSAILRTEGKAPTTAKWHFLQSLTYNLRYDVTVEMDAVPTRAPTPRPAARPTPRPTRFPTKAGIGTVDGRGWKDTGDKLGGVSVLKDDGATSGLVDKDKLGDLTFTKTGSPTNKAVRDTGGTTVIIDDKARDALAGATTVVKTTRSPTPYPSKARSSGSVIVKDIGGGTDWSAIGAALGTPEPTAVPFVSNPALANLGNLNFGRGRRLADKKDELTVTATSSQEEARIAVTFLRNSFPSVNIGMGPMTVDVSVDCNVTMVIETEEIDFVKDQGGEVKATITIKNAVPERFVKSGSGGGGGRGGGVSGLGPHLEVDKDILDKVGGGLNPPRGGPVPRDPGVKINPGWDFGTGGALGGGPLGPGTVRPVAAEAFAGNNAFLQQTKPLWQQQGGLQTNSPDIITNMLPSYAMPRGRRRALRGADDAAAAAAAAAAADDVESPAEAAVRRLMEERELASPGSMVRDALKSDAGSAGSKVADALKNAGVKKLGPKVIEALGGAFSGSTWSKATGSVKVMDAAAELAKQVVANAALTLAVTGDIRNPARFHNDPAYKSLRRLAVRAGGHAASGVAPEPRAGHSHAQARRRLNDMMAGAMRADLGAMGAMGAMGGAGDYRVVNDKAAVGTSSLFPKGGAGALAGGDVVRAVDVGGTGGLTAGGTSSGLKDVTNERPVVDTTGLGRITGKTDVMTSIKKNPGLIGNGGAANYGRFSNWDLSTKEKRETAPDWVVLKDLKDKAYFGGVHVLPGKGFTEMGDLKPGRGCSADYIKSGSVEAYIGLFSGKGRSGLTSERPSHFDPGRGGKATSWGFGKLGGSGEKGTVLAYKIGTGLVELVRRSYDRFGTASAGLPAAAKARAAAYGKTRRLHTGGADLGADVGASTLAGEGRRLEEKAGLEDYVKDLAVTIVGGETKGGPVNIPCIVEGMCKKDTPPQRGVFTLRADFKADLTELKLDELPFLLDVTLPQLAADLDCCPHSLLATAVIPAGLRIVTEGKSKAALANYPFTLYPKVIIPDAAQVRTLLSFMGTPGYDVQLYVSGSSMYGVNPETGIRDDPDKESGGVFSHLASKAEKGFAIAGPDPNQEALEADCSMEAPDTPTWFLPFASEKSWSIEATSATMARFAIDLSKGLGAESEAPVSVTLRSFSADIEFAGLVVGTVRASTNDLRIEKGKAWPKILVELKADAVNGPSKCRPREGWARIDPLSFTWNEPNPQTCGIARLLESLIAREEMDLRLKLKWKNEGSAHFTTARWDMHMFEDYWTQWSKIAEYNKGKDACKSAALGVPVSVSKLDLEAGGALFDLDSLSIQWTNSFFTTLADMALGAITFGLVDIESDPFISLKTKIGNPLAFDAKIDGVLLDLTLDDHDGADYYWWINWFFGGDSPYGPRSKAVTGDSTPLATDLRLFLGTPDGTDSGAKGTVVPGGGSAWTVLKNLGFSLAVAAISNVIGVGELLARIMDDSDKGKMCGNLENGRLYVNLEKPGQAAFPLTVYLNVESFDMSSTYGKHGCELPPNCQPDVKDAFNFRDNWSTSTLKLNRPDSDFPKIWSGGKGIDLVNEGGIRSSVFFKTQQYVLDTWEATFQYRIDKRRCTWCAFLGNADGFVFTLQNDSVNKVGESCAIEDYCHAYRGTRRSIGILFDVYWKDEVALFRDGNSQCNWFGCDVEDEDCDDLFWGLYERDINCHRDNDRLAFYPTGSIGAYDNNRWHNVRIMYYGNLKRLYVWVDDMRTNAARLLSDIDLNWIDWNNGKAFVGLTASTGNVYASKIQIDNFQFGAVKTSAAQVQLLEDGQTYRADVSSRLNLRTYDSCGYERMRGGDSLVVTAQHRFQTSKTMGSSKFNMFAQGMNQYYAQTTFTTPGLWDIKLSVNGGTAVKIGAVLVEEPLRRRRRRRELRARGHFGLGAEHDGEALDAHLESGEGVRYVDDPADLSDPSLFRGHYDHQHSAAHRALEARATRVEGNNVALLPGHRMGHHAPPTRPDEEHGHGPHLGQRRRLTDMPVGHPAHPDTERAPFVPKQDTEEWKAAHPPHVRVRELIPEGMRVQAKRRVEL